jgi:hypothetical protein
MTPVLPMRRQITERLGIAPEATIRKKLRN